MRCPTLAHREQMRACPAVLSAEAPSAKVEAICKVRAQAGTDMLERRLYLHIDWLLFAAIVCLSIIGVAMIYSTTGAWRLPTTQVYAMVIGAVAFVICLTVDYRALTDKS